MKHLFVSGTRAKNFILKTTVMSASYERKITEGATKLENAPIERNDASIRGKDGILYRLQHIEVTGKISLKDVADAKMVVEDMEIMQVITSKEVMRILSCQTTKARSILKMMETQGLIKKIQGKGKGKYILNVSN